MVMTSPSDFANELGATSIYDRGLLRALAEKSLHDNLRVLQHNQG